MLKKKVKKLKALIQGMAHELRDQVSHRKLTPIKVVVTKPRRR